MAIISDTKRINLELLIASEIIYALDIIRELTIDEIYTICRGDHPKGLNKNLFREVFNLLVSQNYIRTATFSERGKPLYSLTEKGYNSLKSKIEEYSIN